jgi:DNA-binding MarR family transcriptional regulator
VTSDRGRVPRDDVDEIQDAWERELPGVPVGSIGVITRIWRTGRLLDAERAATMRALGMDPPTRDLLSTLRRAGAPYALTPSEIARRTHVTDGAVSQRLAKAEAAGLVRRRPQEHDRRSVVVELTARGRRLVDRTVGELLAHEETLLEPLTPAERVRLADLLRRLQHGLEQRKADRSD